MLGGVGGEEQMGKGKKRGRDGRNNGKAIVFLRRYENFLIQRGYLLKFELGGKKAFESVYELLFLCLFFLTCSPHLYILIFTPYLVHASLVWSSGTMLLSEQPSGCFSCFQSTLGRRHSLP